MLLSLWGKIVKKNTLTITIMTILGSGYFFLAPDLTSSTTTPNNNITSKQNNLAMTSPVSSNQQNKQMTMPSFPVANTQNINDTIPVITDVINKEGVVQLAQFMQQNPGVLQSGVALDIKAAKTIYPPDTVLKRNEQLFIKPIKNKVIKVSDAVAVEQLIREAGAEFFQFSLHDSVQLVSAQRDTRGNIFYKYDQKYKNVPVFGKQLVVQINKHDQLKLLSGVFEPQIDISVTPQMPADLALSKSYQQMHNRPTSEPIVRVAPQLMIYADMEQEPVLTYRSVVEYYTEDKGFRVDQIFVNANTGELVNAIPHRYSVLSRELYTFDKQCLTSYNRYYLPGQQTSANADNHTQPMYKHMESTYWFYKNMFDRNSYDGKGATLRATVHITFQYEQGGECSGDNGMYDPSVDQVLMGEGGYIFDRPAQALDFVGHEYSHGFTASSSNLTYQDESGAINEGMSDVFGAGIEAWKDSGGSALGNPDVITASADNWQIFEDTGKVINGIQIGRYMSDPQKDGQSKDDYTDRYTGDEDSGGVHWNSGIFNLIFYLVSEGGQHPRGASDVDVTGIGIEKALHIFYEANNSLFSASTNFKGARYLLAQAAENQFGECSQAWNTIHQAFDAVNVPGSWTACGDNPADPPVEPPVSEGDNLALGSAKSSSSEQNSSSFATYHLTDGDYDTTWASSTIFNALQMDWVGLGFDRSTTFNTVKIFWDGTDIPKEAQIWAWDGNNWKNIAINTNISGDSTTFSFAPETAEFIGITLSGGKWFRWYAINEVEVYNN